LVSPNLVLLSPLDSYRLVNDLFGNDADLSEQSASIEKVIVLLWLFRDSETVLEYLTNLMEMVRHEMIIDKVLERSAVDSISSGSFCLSFCD